MWILDFRELYLPLLAMGLNTLYNVMGVKRHVIPIDLSESESISGIEINFTVSAISNGVLCCNLAICVEDVHFKTLP